MGEGNTLKGICKDLDQMLGLIAGAVLYLLAAGYALGHHQEVALLSADGWKQHLLSDFEGDVVVLLLESEGAGHAAAARLYLRDIASWDGTEQLHGGLRSHERLLVAVALQQDFSGWIAKRR